MISEVARFRKKWCGYGSGVVSDVVWFREVGVTSEGVTSEVLTAGLGQRILD